MFLQQHELKDVIHEYQVEQITEGDDAIVMNAIAVAIEKVRSYLTGNSKKEWFDGRVRYDVEQIFNKTGTERNSLILAYVKVCAEWELLQLCNPDVIYEKAKDRYDRTLDDLKKIARGEITISSLPVKADDVTGSELPFRMGGRTKFNHE
jgi:hypothetical protein